MRRLCKKFNFFPEIGLLSVLLLLFFVGVSNVAAQVQAKAEISTDTPVFHVGDQVTLRVVVEHPSGFRVIPPQLDGEWGDVEVVA
ncbi:MAG TPA: hypothetical protein ENJ56_05705, partial [Anaerolineae bacterium]|nr:hypothetical protein [Anaerolineae bacterium]